MGRTRPAHGGIKLGMRSEELGIKSLSKYHTPMDIAHGARYHAVTQ